MQNIVKNSYFWIVLLCAGAFMWFFVGSNNTDKKPPVNKVTTQIPREIDSSEKTTTTLEDWQKQYPDLKTYVFKSKPQDLSANVTHPGIITNEPFSFPEDAWFVGMVPAQFGADHALHHADIINTSRTNYFCDNGMPTVITATGEELMPGYLPLGYGLFVSKQDKLMATVMYHNEDAFPLSDVQTQITFYYIPKNKAPLTEVMPFFFDVVGPCMWGDYKVAPKSTDTKTMTPEYAVTKPGKIVYMGIHMHHYASSFSFLLNGKAIKTVSINNSEEGNELVFPSYTPANLSVQKGDRLGISATYKNTTDKEIDAMAEALFYFVPQ